jgi:hypothetical protein
MQEYPAPLEEPPCNPAVRRREETQEETQEGTQEGIQEEIRAETPELEEEQWEEDRPLME